MSSNKNSKVAIITGAGTGVGRSVAQRFLTEGYQVALLGRRQELLEETAAGTENSLILPCDVSQPEAVDTALPMLLTSGVELMSFSITLEWEAHQEPSMKPQSRTGSK